MAVYNSTQYHKYGICVLHLWQMPAYSDVVNFAKRVKAPGWYSWRFNDTTCPPTSMYAAYNVIPATKELKPYSDTGRFYRDLSSFAPLPTGSGCPETVNLRSNKSRESPKSCQEEKLVFLW
jgi:hypothetical protein